MHRSDKMSLHSYEEAIDWLFEVRRFGSKPGLKIIRYLLNKIGNPQNSFKSIHVTGTNGKGSTTVMTSSILIAAGYKVGMFTSPHLINFTERIQINNREITKEEVMKNISELKPIIEEMEKDPELRHPTFFEIITAIAFKHFSEMKVDFTVLEVGMGGELDATNVVKALVSIVTNVSLEHTSVLGETVQEIAEKKGGIIKKGGVLITATEDESVYEVLSNMCQDRDSLIFRVGRDITVEPVKTTNKGQLFNLKGFNGEYRNLTIPLMGKHQLTNAATATAAVEALSFHGIDTTEQDIQTGLQNIRWPGRLEIIARNPLVVLDGAKDIAASEAATKAMSDFTYDKLTLVVSISSDKKVTEMMENFSKVADRFIVTEHSVQMRASKPVRIAKEAEKHGIPYEIIPEVKEAVKHAIKTSNPSDMVLVIGSVFLVGEAREMWYLPN